MKSFCRKFI